MQIRVRALEETFFQQRKKHLFFQIFFVNINMVQHRLFIGLKNQTMVDEVEKLLHDRIFIEQHYHRLYR